MKILGIACGREAANSEILLIEALEAARQTDGVEVELLRLNDLSLPKGLACTNDFDVPDDSDWLWERLLECDGFIISTPVYNRSIPGRLKDVADLLLGPEADMGFMLEMKELRARGDRRGDVFRLDDRLFKNRVAAFIAVGGATVPSWKSLALPTCYALTLSMKMSVVDMMLVKGVAEAGAITVDSESLERARQVGGNVAGQLGLAPEAVEFKGRRGLCPSCHLDVFVLRENGQAECATCGVTGVLGRRDGAHVFTATEQQLAKSLLGLEGARDHFWEITEVADRVQEHLDEIDENRKAYQKYDAIVRPARHG